MSKREAIETELEAIEEQYRGKAFSELPREVQECWNELFERSEQMLLEAA